MTNRARRRREAAHGGSFGRSVPKGLHLAAAFGLFGLFGLFGMFGLVGRAAAVERASEAERFLREQKGLLPIGRGQVWISETETHIRRRLAGLEALETQIRSTQRGLEERVERNRLLWIAQQARTLQIRRLLKGLSSGDPQRKRLEAELRRLAAQASPPIRLGGTREVQRELIGLINDRNEMTVSLFWIRRNSQRMRAQYVQLAADPEVVSALAQLGDQHQLGPDKDYPKQARKYESLVLTDWVPLYRQSDRLRFCVLAADETPLTFSWRDDEGPTLVPLSMLQRMGHTLPEDAPRVEQRVGGRRFLTTRVTLPPLRLGRWVLREVEAFVLPAEGEDVGAMLGRSACVPLSPNVQPEQLRIVLGPSE